MNKYTITLTLIAAIIGALWLMQPTQADIAACMTSTNYSADRCAHELTR